MRVILPMISVLLLVSLVVDRLELVTINSEEGTMTFKMIQNHSGVFQPRGESKTDDTIDTVNVEEKISTTQNATLVVHLTGELGNQLNHLARGLGIQIMAREEFGLNLNLIMKQQLAGGEINGKGPATKKILDRCFPYFRGMDFRLGNRPSYDDRKRQQANWTLAHERTLTLINSNSLEDVRKALDHVLELSQSSRKPAVDENADILLPFVETKSMKAQSLLDRYYDEISKLLAFNDTACCKLLPDPDESVFHYRNFLGEMSNNGKHDDFEELNPLQIAHQLFAHLQPGDKVAITGRFRHDATAPSKLVQALQNRGIQVRVIRSQSAHDFCFLKEAKKELVGTVRSTFVKWAGYLGNADIVRFYVLDSPGMRRRFGKNLLDRFNQTWTHPKQTSRMRVELYKKNLTGMR